MSGKWFPPTISEEEIEREENRKLNELAQRVVGRMDAVREDNIGFDNFTVSFEPVVRKATMIAFMKELLEVLAGMNANGPYEMSCYFYSETPRAATLENIGEIVAKTIPSPNSRVFLVEMRKKSTNASR